MSLHGRAAIACEYEGGSKNTFAGRGRGLTKTPAFQIEHQDRALIKRQDRKGQACKEKQGDQRNALRVGHGGEGNLSNINAE